MSSNFPRILIDRASSPSAEQSADANIGAHFTPAGLADSSTLEGSRTITDIDRFLAMFGTNDPALNGEERQDRSGKPTAGSDSDHDKAGPLPDIGAAGFGDSPSPGSNPGSDPVPPPPQPVPVGQGPVQPAPVPANQLAPGLAEPIPQSNPLVPNAGPGTNAGNNGVSQGSDTSADPGAGGSSTSGRDSGDGSATESAGGFKPDPSVSKDSSSSSSSSSGGGGGGGFHFGGGGGLHFGGGGISLGGGGVGPGPLIAAGGAVSVVVRSVTDGGAGINPGAGHDHRDTSTQPPDQDMPPVSSGPATPPVQPPTQGPDMYAAWQRAFDAFSEVARKLVDDERRCYHLRDEEFDISIQIDRANVQIRERETQLNTESTVFKNFEAELKIYRAHNAAVQELRDENLAAMRAAQSRADVARSRASEAYQALQHARTSGPDGCDGITDAVNFGSEQNELIVNLRKTLVAQNVNHRREQAAADDLRNKVRGEEYLIRQNEIEIARWQAAYREEVQRIKDGDSYIADLNHYIAAKESALARVHAEDVINHASRLEGIAALIPLKAALDELSAFRNGRWDNSGFFDQRVAEIGPPDDRSEGDAPDDMPLPPSHPGTDTGASHTTTTSGATGGPDDGHESGDDVDDDGDSTMSVHFNVSLALQIAVEPTAPPATPTDTPAHRGLSVQVEMTHPASLTVGSTAILSAEAVANKLPIMHAIVDAWMRTLPVTAELEFQGFDILDPDGPGPVTLALQFAPRPGHAAGASLSLPADEVAVLKAAIQGAVADWEHDQESAAQVGAIAAALHYGLRDMITGDSVSLAFEFSPPCGASESAAFDHRSHDVQALRGVLAHWIADSNPAFAATVVAYEIDDLTDHGDIRLQVLVNAMPVIPDPATLIALQNAMQAYLAAPEAHAPDYLLDSDAMPEPMLSVVGVAAHGALG